MIRKTLAIICTVAALTAISALTWGGEQSPADKPAAEASPAPGKGQGGCGMTGGKGGNMDHRCGCGCCCKCEGGAKKKQTGCMKDGKGAMKGNCAKMSSPAGTYNAPAKQEGHSHPM